MIDPIFNDGRIASLEDLYSSISSSSIINIKEAMRCVVASTGIVMSGDAFAAYINNDKIIVPIGSILFGNYELFSPIKTTSVALDMPSYSSEKTVALVATLEYEYALPYPAYPDPSTINNDVEIYMLSVPTITLSLEDYWVATDNSVKIGDLVYSEGKITYVDKRRINALTLINPPDISVGVPITSLDPPQVYSLPSMNSGIYPAGMDTKHNATFVKLSWTIPEGMTSLQYFGIDLVPESSGVEYPERKVSTQYFPKTDEIDAKGPAHKAFVNMRCVSGLKYKAYLYGYFSRRALVRKLLDSVSFAAAGDNISPDNELTVQITDLTPSGISMQIDTDYAGSDRIQVFIKKASSTSDTVDRQNLYYEGPPAPVIYSDNEYTHIVVRAIDKYNTVISSSSEVLHMIKVGLTTADREEQLTFTVPCNIDPTTKVASVTVASFTAPYDFKITKGIFYNTRNKETSDPTALIDGKITVYDDGASVYSFSYADDYTTTCKLGYSTSLSGIVDQGNTVVIKAEKNASDIDPYYGVVILYIKKVTS